MSSRKKMKSDHSSKKLTLDELAINFLPIQEHKPNPHSRKLPSLEEPDVSMIQKVSQGNQLEELDDSFDHPLHSTALDAYGEEQSRSESLGQVSEPQRKNTERSKKTPRSKTSDGDDRKCSAADSEDKSLTDNVKSQNTPQFQAKKKQPLEENTSDPSVDSPYSVQVWCPKEIKRSTRDITELDIVLTEFEKITANYRQSIESDICRKAINSFCAAFKDEITDLIVEVQELENMKKRNAKVLTDMKKKRQQLFQLGQEQLRAEQQLVRLQTEYAEVQERQSALRQATELLTHLKELQQDCLDYREENPTETMVYGISSLPALLVESRRILQAEKHFQNINMKLEEALAVQRQKLSEKH
ncbi:centromere protein U [Neopsephotus bourkii]|uniref:centromere protein U n=1 Tax=Neopsephotus bourkii TaxID=309878 RepID=UPI002AA5C239|nr:centromere protein U [Neopsephotus bourkii]